MSDRLSDEQVAHWTSIDPEMVDSAMSHAVFHLAREVRESRRILAAIRALPDTLDSTFSDAARETYRVTMRQVKALLEPLEGL
jgi:hypothetical protein